MPSYRNRLTLGLGRGVKAFLNLEAGLSRGSVSADRPDSEQIAVNNGPVLINDKHDSDQQHGANLKVGDRDYRAWVGPPRDYDLMASIQVALLLTAGLRETHYLVDVGCGSLRAGRMLIPYLRSGRYFGIEPNRWLVEEGIERELGKDILKTKHPTFSFVDDFSIADFGVQFDFAVAQSVFSHAYPDLVFEGLRGIARALAPGGKLLATFKEGETVSEGSGWIYPGTVPYTWEAIQGLIEKSGLVARRLDWMHPRQSWFIAAHPEAESEVENLSNRLRPPLQSPEIYSTKNKK